MLDHEDLKWIATTSTELNSSLQQIGRLTDLARQHKGEQSYLTELAERVELASKSAQAIFDRVTSKILERSAARPPASANVTTRTPSFSVVRPSAAPPPRPPEAKKEPATDEPNPEGIPAEIKVLNPSGARELILLVEDEKEVAELAGVMLTDEGYKVILAYDGFEALRIYQQIGPQVGLIILDFFLPVMDGDAVFDEFRALNPNVDVVLSSGFAEQGKLSNMLAQGLRGFIPKPYTREKLLAQVRSTLDSPRSQSR